MKKLILLAMISAAMLATAPAKAEFILNNNTFADLGATGFGNAPRLLSLQNIGTESGAVVSNAGATAFLSPITVSPTFQINGTSCNSNGTCSGGGLLVNQSALVNVTSLWTSGANVGVGLDTNQTGSTGALLFSALVLNIYNSVGTLLGTFGGNDAVLISEAQLALQQGNGNSVFNLGLDAAEQAQFNALLAALPAGAQIFAGLGATFGCSPAPCIGGSNDGAESFLAFSQSAVSQVPVPPAVWLFASGIGGLWALGRRRKQKKADSQELAMAS